MLAHIGDGLEGREVPRLAARFGVELGAGRPTGLALPFAGVRTAVDVQHLPGYLIGFR